MSAKHRIQAAIRRAVASDQSGATALEFAIIAPVFVMLLLGICTWGGYFWLSHSVQQLANDAARASLGGLSSAERKSLAQASLTTDIAQYAPLSAARANLAVQDSSQVLTVSVIYDASDSPFFALSTLVPMPSSLINRSATIRQGGY
jgi:Flp pilus assembly protein TadG